MRLMVEEEEESQPGAGEGLYAQEWVGIGEAKSLP